MNRPVRAPLLHRLQPLAAVLDEFVVDDVHLAGWRQDGDQAGYGVHDPFLIASEARLLQQARLLQPDRGLVRGDIEQKPFRDGREVESPGSCDDDAELTVEAQSGGREGNVGSGCSSQRVADAHRLDRRPAFRIVQPHTHECQPEHAEQRVGERAHDLTRFAARGQGRQRHDAGQIVETVTQPRDFLGRRFVSRVHRRPFRTG